MIQVLLKNGKFLRFTKKIVGVEEKNIDKVLEFDEKDVHKIPDLNKNGDLILREKTKEEKIKEQEFLNNIEKENKKYRILQLDEIIERGKKYNLDMTKEISELESLLNG